MIFKELSLWIVDEVSMLFLLYDNGILLSKVLV